MSPVMLRAASLCATTSGVPSVPNARSLPAPQPLRERVELSPRPARASLLHQIPLHCFTIKGSRWKPGEAALLLKILLRKFFDLHSQSFTPPSSASCLSCPFLLSHFFRLSPFLHPTGKPSQFFPLVSFYVFSHNQNSILQVILTIFSCENRLSMALSSSLTMTGQDIFWMNSLLNTMSLNTNMFSVFGFSTLLLPSYWTRQNLALVWHRTHKQKCFVMFGPSLLKCFINYSICDCCKPVVFQACGNLVVQRKLVLQFSCFALMFVL